MISNFGTEKTIFADAFLISSFAREDSRGEFVKFFERDIYTEFGIDFSLNEAFLSRSSKNVIRGMHFQLHNPQAKLVTVIKGAVYDVIVDLRKDSPTYKMWQGFSLSDDNRKALYIPKGFAHGFVALEENTDLLYMCDGKYDGKTDTGIRFDDPDINIAWPLDDNDNVIVSDRDKGLMSFQEFEKIGWKF